MNRTMSTWLLCALLLLGARSVFAIDGLVLINQSTVATSGGFPYRITQPGSYKLSGNLVAPVNKGAIVIASSNVTLDLNGFTIACAAAYPGAPYSVDCVSDGSMALGNVVVRNGSITLVGTATSLPFGYFLNGLSLGFSHGTTVEDIHFDGSGNYVMTGLNGGINSIIRHNIFSGLAGPNIYCPSLVDGNVNGTASAGSAGTGCYKVNNVGVFL